jgi:hypothetical protein
VDGLAFDREQIVRLEDTAFVDLVSRAECHWVWPRVWPNTQHARRVPGEQECCLALNGDKSYYCMEFEPVEDLNLLLDCSRVVSYRDTESRLVVLQEGSLRDVVTQRCRDGVLGMPRTVIPVSDAEDHYGNSYTDEAVAAWGSKAIFGQLAICGCGEAGCGATYAWIQDGQCRLLVEVSAAGIYQIEVGPFTPLLPA